MWRTAMEEAVGEAEDHAAREERQSNGGQHKVFPDLDGRVIIGAYVRLEPMVRLGRGQRRREYTERLHRVEDVFFSGELESVMREVENGEMERKGDELTRMLELTRPRRRQQIDQGLKR